LSHPLPDGFYDRLRLEESGEAPADFFRFSSHLVSHSKMALALNLLFMEILSAPFSVFTGFERHYSKI